MNDYLIIDITIYDLDTFLLKCLNLKYDFIKISYHNHILRCKVSKSTYLKLKNYYRIKIIRSINIYSIIKYLKKNILFLTSILFGILLFIFFTHLILKVEIKTTNEELSKRISLSLDDLGLKRLKLIKSKDELNLIKNTIETTYKDEIEWLEISLEGLNYVITLEERKIKLPNTKEDYCNLYATMDGMVTRVQAKSGIVMVHENSYVKAGDLLISGDITLNEETKSKICATGTIYGEVWYKANITVPKTYKEKTYTGKVQYNLQISYNKDYKIFKSHFTNYEEDTKKIISILGLSLNLVKEKEINYEEKTYTDSELEDKINTLIMDKVGISNTKDEKILYKNILKKEEFDSTIEIEAFVTVEKILGSNE